MAGESVSTSYQSNGLMHFSWSPPLPHAFEEVEKWLDELDRKETIDEVRTFIYQVKNGIAGELSDILNAIFTKDKKKVTTAARRAEPFTKGAVPGQVKAQKARQNS